METETLIRALRSQIEPLPHAPLARRFALALVSGIFGGGLMLIFTLGLRADFETAAVAMALKMIFSASIAAFLLTLLTKVARPGVGNIGWMLMGSLTLISLTIAAIALANESSIDRMAAFTGGGFPWCIVFIPVFSAPSGLGLVWAMREAAPTRLRMAGALCGALSGAIAALVYSTFCPIDSVAFVTTWYVAGMTVSAAVGALIGPTALRW